MRNNKNIRLRLILPLLAMLLLMGIVSAASNTVSLTIYGLPAGANFIWRAASNYTTYTSTISNYTTQIPIYISNSVNATYSGRIPWQYQGAGTTVAYNGVTYTMLTGNGGTCATQIINTNGLNNYCIFYVYLNSSLWNTNQIAMLKQVNSSLSSAKLIVASIRNTTMTVQYGAASTNGVLLAAGSIKKNATYSTTKVGNTVASSISFQTINVVKASNYPCITTNLASTAYCTNSSTPTPIKFIITPKMRQQGYYWANFTMTASLLGGNKANFNYTIKDITNSTMLVPLTTITSASSVSVTKSYKVPLTHQIEIDFNSNGNANYSKVIDDPVTVPTNIVAYQQLSIVTGNTISANTPLKYIVDAGANKAYIASNFQNIAPFNTVSGALINGWNFNGISNTVNSVTIWLNPPFGYSGTYNDIAIGYYTIGTNNYNVQTWGANPILTSTYGQYADSGANVFTQYGGGSGWGTFTAVGGTDRRAHV